MDRSTQLSRDAQIDQPAVVNVFRKLRLARTDFKHLTVLSGCIVAIDATNMKRTGSRSKTHRPTPDSSANGQLSGELLRTDQLPGRL